MYARAFFEKMDFDSVTVAPYMGSDSVKPFLDFEGKWVIVLALTSNTGGLDFQMTEDNNGIPLYKKVLSTVQNWGNNITFCFPFFQPLSFSLFGVDLFLLGHLFL
mgnify:CR=1 FL=1